MALRSKQIKPLKPSQLRATIPRTWLKPAQQRGDLFQGQERALAAMELAATVDQQGFNLFVMGQSGFGRHQAVTEVLEKEAARRPAPPDWIYVYNFEKPDSPKAIKLPTGQAHLLRKAMEYLVDDLANDIPAIFESDDYQNKRQLIADEFADLQEKAFNDLLKRINEKGLALLRTPMGFAIVASKEGRALKAEEFQALPEAEQQKINALISEQQVYLEDFVKQIPKREKQHRHKIERLNAEVAQNGVDDAIKDLVNTFGHIEAVKSHLEAVRVDMIENADLFLSLNSTAKAGAFPVATSKHYEAPQFQRYLVNVLVGAASEDKARAGVITATLPTYSNLVGRVEHTQEMGALVTNFTMIKAGEFHRANGGFLVIDARQLLTEPYAWDALKRALKTNEIRISSVGERLSLLTTTTLAPDPVPVDFRVILIGERIIYYLLCAHDPDFSSLFKIAADFEDEIPVSRKNAVDLAGNILAIASSCNLKPVNPDGLTSLLFEATRLAEDAERFSLNRERISDLLIEADYCAGLNEKNVIGSEEVEEAIAGMEDRSGRIKKLSQEAIDRNIMLVDTAGAVVGQINGLSVLQLGNLRFGKPSRITVQTRMGKGQVIDIEREVELGGPIHSKGVLILSGYLAANYALDVPLSLWASIVFEQSYGGVDGDSASAAELLALMSSLAATPINQSFAITGSVNQKGDIQAIGGVNEKIEGFFDICAARGLSGTQGVVIPVANMKNLALRPRVVEAVAASKFQIYAVTTIGEAAQLMMDKPFGIRDKGGAYPDQSINDLVEDKLRSFARQQRGFLKGKSLGEDDGQG